MPDFKQLAEGEKSADLERYILIEVIHEPAIGNQYLVTGKGLDLDRQTSGDFTRRTQKEARTRALEQAEAVSVPIIYLSSGVAQTET
jgi:tagatose-1,6-bisphosphate aldolase